MNSERILEEAVSIIQKGWTKGGNARDKNEHALPPDADSACMLGLANRVFNILETRAGEDNPVFLSSWNDAKSRTQKDVLEILDLVIEQEKAK